MSDFSHLKNKLLAEQVEDQIYHYILDTPVEPGAKLPNEFELGERFGVGRSTIREAVKLLSSKGIVEVRRGSGTYVVTTTKGLSDPLGLRSIQDKKCACTGSCQCKTSSGTRNCGDGGAECNGGRHRTPTAALQTGGRQDSFRRALY